MFKDYREFCWGLGAVVVFIAVFLTAAAIGWTGDVDVCTRLGTSPGVPDVCFCEQFDLSQKNRIQQPGNTWSNLFYVLSGLLILWRLGKDRKQGLIAHNPMITPTLFSIGYGILVLFLGPASMLFHGSLTSWGGWVDLLSLILFGSFLLLYDITRALKLNKVIFVIFYLLITIPMAILIAVLPSDLLIGNWLFTILVILFFILDVILLIKPKSLQRKAWPWWWLALISIGIAFFGFWLWSNTGGPLCNLSGRDSPWQGHAVWHLLSAVTTYSLFLYFRTEKTISGFLKN